MNGLEVKTDTPSVHPPPTPSTVAATPRPPPQLPSLTVPSQPATLLVTCSSNYLPPSSPPSLIRTISLHHDDPLGPPSCKYNVDINFYNCCQPKKNLISIIAVYFDFSCNFSLSILSNN
jgi:hypothetical protein